MNDYLSPHVLIIALTFFLAGIVKGVTGMGLPTVAMGILGAVTCVARVVVPQLRCWSFRPLSPIFGSCSRGRISWPW